MTASFKPGRQSTQTVVVFKEQYFVAAICKSVCSGKTSEAGPDNYYIVTVFELRERNWHMRDKGVVGL